MNEFVLKQWENVKSDTKLLYYLYILHLTFIKGMKSSILSCLLFFLSRLPPNRCKHEDWCPAIGCICML